MTIASVPKSLEGLTSLRTLSLNFCDLKGDVSIIGSMQCLEILSFSSSNIKELPRELGKLTRLRLLDLTRCAKLSKIGPGVLSNLTCLEELYMKGITFKWEEEVNTSFQRDEPRASFKDLKKLAKLIALEIKIPDEVPPAGLVVDNLKKFNIFNASDDTFKGPNLYGGGNTLVLKADKSVLVEGLIKRLCDKTVHLCLMVNDLRSIPKEIEREGFSMLRTLKLVSCGGLVSIASVDQARANIFPNLEILHLENLGNLEVICRGQRSNDVNCATSSSHSASFLKLRTLELRQCSKLTSIFSLITARNLINLKLLKIVECEMLEEIFSEERVPDQNAVEGGCIAFSGMTRLKLVNLPNLVAFSKALVDVKFPLLEDMNLQGLSKLTNLYSGLKSWGSQHHQPRLSRNKVTIGSVAAATEIQSVQDQDDTFSKLRKICVINCERLINVFPSNSTRTLQNLVYLEIRDCNSIETVFDLEGSNSGESCEVEVLPQLRDVSLTSLPKIKYLLKGSLYLSQGFQNLSRMTPEGSSSTLRVLIMLQRLSISMCQMLEAIFSDGVADVLKIELPKLEELSLIEVPNLVGFCHSVVEVELPQLENMALEGVPKFGGVYPKNGGSDHQLASREHPSCKTMVTLTNLMKRSHKLQKLRVVECHLVEVVFDLEPLNFNRGFQKLRSLCFLHCDSLIRLFTTPVAKMIMKLEDLEISECMLLEAVVAKEDEDEDEGILFPQLTRVKLRGLPNLLTIAPKAYRFNWPSIEEFTMVDCGRGATALLINELPEDNNCTNVQNMNDEHERGTITLKSDMIEKLQNIEYLEFGMLNSIELLFYFTGTGIAPGFENLRLLTLKECDSLRHLFTSTVAKMLVGLEKLEISKCKLLEAIVAKGEGREEGILFPKLRFLHLKRLPNLLTIMPQNFNLSSLELCIVSDCGNVVQAPNHKLHEGDRQVQNVTQKESKMKIDNLTKLISSKWHVDISLASTKQFELEMTQTNKYVFEEVHCFRKPQLVDFRHLIELNNNTEKGSSQLANIIKSWEYKQANALQHFRHVLDNIWEQHVFEEIDCCNLRKDVPQMRNEDGVYQDERVEITIETNRDSIIYWKNCTIHLESLLKECKGHIENQSSAVQKFTNLFERADNFLHLILQNAPIVMGHQDKELRYCYIYNHFPSFSKESFLGKTDVEIFSGSGVKESYDFKKEVMERQIPAIREITFKTELFGSKKFLIYVEPVFSKIGDVIGVSYVSMDITGLPKKLVELDCKTKCKMAKEQNNESLSSSWVKGTNDSAMDVGVETPHKSLDITEEMEITEDPSIDFKNLQNLTKYSEAGSSQLADLVETWEYKQATVVEKLRQELDKLTDQHFEKTCDGVSKEYVRTMSESIKVADQDDRMEILIECEFDTVDYWKKRATDLEKSLKENIGYMEKQSAPVEEFQHIFERGDNFLHFVLQSTPFFIGHQDKELRYRFIYNHFPSSPKESIIGKTDLEIFSGVDMKEINDFKIEVMEIGLPAKREITFKTELCGLKTILMYVEPVYSKTGDKIGVNYVGLDITDQARKRDRMAKCQVDKAIQNANETRNLTELLI